MRAGKGILVPKASGCMLTLSTRSRCPRKGAPGIEAAPLPPCTRLFQPLTFDCLEVPRSAPSRGSGCRACFAVYVREAMSWPYSQPAMRSLVVASAVLLAHPVGVVDEQAPHAPPAFEMPITRRVPLWRRPLIWRHKGAHPAPRGLQAARPPRARRTPLAFASPAVGGPCGAAA
jgi:hypothetical protein